MVWFYRTGCDRCSKHSVRLSIPLWSDFIGVKIILFNEYQLTFNPTMVWFYRFTFQSLVFNQAYLSIPLWSDFIVSHSRASFSTNEIFQSHYGLILSRQYACWSQELSRAFNPTMVWFYPGDIWPAMDCSDITFQSHYGLILSRAKEILDEYTLYPAFNPTMVWFYHGGVFLLKPDLDPELSIPLWSDFITAGSFS